MDVVDFVVSPIEHPIHWLVTTVRPAQDVINAQDPAQAALLAQIQQLQFQLLQEQRKVQELRRQIAEFTAGQGINPDLPVRMNPAQVIGPGGDASGGILKIRAGTAEGVLPNDVAVIFSINLVGRVVDASTHVSRILTITDRGAGRIRGVVMLDETVPGRSSPSSPPATARSSANSSSAPAN